MEELAVRAGPDLVNDRGLQQRHERIRSEPYLSACMLSRIEAIQAEDRGEGGHLQIKENAARHVLAGTGLGEERVECVVTATDRLVGGHLSIRLDAMLQAVQLPAGIANLRISQITLTAVPIDPVPERSSLNHHELVRPRRPQTCVLSEHRRARCGADVRASGWDMARWGDAKRSGAISLASADGTLSSGNAATAAGHYSLNVNGTGLRGRSGSAACLDAGLADVDGDHFAHGGRCLTDRKKAEDRKGRERGRAFLLRLRGARTNLKSLIPAWTTDPRPGTKPSGIRTDSLHTRPACLIKFDIATDLAYLAPLPTARLPVARMAKKRQRVESRDGTEHRHISSGHE